MSGIFSRLLASRSLWLLLVVAATLAAAFLGGALTTPGPPWSTVVVPTMGAVELCTLFLLPLVAAELSHNPGAPAIGTGLGFMLSRAAALLVALVLSLLAASASIVVFTLLGGNVHGPSLAALLLGHLLLGVFVIGLSLFMCSLTRRLWPAVLATVALTGGSYVVHRSGAPGAPYVPTAGLSVFAGGVIDMRDVMALLIGGLGPALAAATVWSPALSRSQKVLATAGLVVVTLGLAGAVSQLELAFDLSPASQG